MEIQRAMLAANLKSSQEALVFLGRMQSLENLEEFYRKLNRNKIRQISRENSREFEIKEEVVVTARHREKLGMWGTGTGRVIPEPRTDRTRQSDDATIRRIEGICNKHTN